MKNALRIVLFVVIAFSFAYAQTPVAPVAKVKVEAVTPHKLTSLGLTSTTNSVSTGLRIVGNNTFVYLSPVDWSHGEITSAEFAVTRVTGGTVVPTTTFNGNWVYFQPVNTGEYRVVLTVTTAGGTDQDTISIWSSNFIGVGTVDGVAPVDGMTCMDCHEGEEPFDTFFAPYKDFSVAGETGHEVIFSREVETSTHYGTNCMKCHTTGYDHNSAADNNGFDDIAADEGWVYSNPTHSTKWDSLKTVTPNLAKYATIGCEMCHGPASSHTSGTNKASKIEISVEVGACAQCHDEPGRHNKVAEYEKSLHAEALWSSSFKRATTDNSIANNCGRCHDGNIYVGFTKGEVFNAVNFTEDQHVAITCATCHDPHTLEIRQSPAGSDTLGNGYDYSSLELGSGNLCLDCHKSRRNVTTYVPSGTINSHWGPHHSTQGDVLLGQGAADFGTPFMSSSHNVAVEDACVGCHMSIDNIPAYPDTVDRSNVIGHTWKLHNDVTDKDFTTACASCHGAKESFEEFEASADYDADGSIESVQEEIDGLIAILDDYLLPLGPGIDVAQIQAANDLNMRKAYYNYQLIAYDGSRGVHNTKFAIDVLRQSITAIGGVVPVELVSFSADVQNGIVTLAWETATETNNKGFEVEKKVGNSWKSVKFVQGHGTSSSPNKYSYEFALEGKASFRLKQIDMDGTFEYSKEIEVTGANTPKQYTLSQNYPNPFNPSTSIKYSLPFESNVKVVIYSITGEVVKTLVNTVRTAGNHEAQFSVNDLGINVSSGIYFYSLEASALDGSASFKQTKKMVLMK